jgi:hypothetical protein
VCEYGRESQCRDCGHGYKEKKIKGSKLYPKTDVYQTQGDQERLVSPKHLMQGMGLEVGAETAHEGCEEAQTHS